MLHRCSRPPPSRRRRSTRNTTWPAAMDPEAKALDYHDVLLRQGDVQLLAGPHWLNDQVRADGVPCAAKAAHIAAALCCSSLFMLLFIAVSTSAAGALQVIAFFFEYLQREVAAGAGVLLVSPDSTYLLASLGEMWSHPYWCCLDTEQTALGFCAAAPSCSRCERLEPPLALQTRPASSPSPETCRRPRCWAGSGA